MESFANQLSRPHVSRRPSQDESQIAAILDDFSTQCFERDANLWAITPDRVTLDLEIVRPDFLLVESAWNGNSGAWRYQITSPNGPKPSLISTIRACKEQGIPTVFWNKEDPPHFEEFLRTAKLFDFILTTDEDMVPNYEKFAPGSKAEMMRFAAAESIHNPRYVDGYRQGDIAFAGQYFRHKFPERREQMDILFPPAGRFKFQIFSRVLGGDPNYQFPDKYGKFVSGSLPYSEMVREYVRHKVFLNVNSVPNSKTMCARRVFELSAAKTACVGIGSEAIRSVFREDEVLTVNDSREAFEVYKGLIENESYRRVTTQKAWRRTLSEHTYRHRLDQIRNLIGIAMPNAEEKIHIVLRSTDQQQCQSLVDDLKSQRFDHGSRPEIEASWADERPDFEPQIQGIRFVNQSEFKNARLCMLDGRYHYGPNFLSDLLLTHSQQKTKFVTKSLMRGKNWPHATEERVTDQLPEWGWLSESLEFKSGVIPLNELSVGKDSSLEVYVGDPFGLSSKYDPCAPEVLKG